MRLSVKKYKEKKILFFPCCKQSAVRKQNPFLSQPFLFHVPNSPLHGEYFSLCSSIAVRRFFKQRLSSSSSLSPPLLCSGFFSRHRAWTFAVGTARRRYPLRRVGLKNPGCRWLSPHGAAPGVFKYPAVEPLRFLLRPSAFPARSRRPLILCAARYAPCLLPPSKLTSHPAVLWLDLTGPC